jgi:phage terminase small subunit
VAASAKTKKYLESDLFSEIKNDLLDQLERNGTTGKYYTDLVGDYMDMWVTKCLLVDDIQQRGVIVKYDNGGGQKGKKKNDSVEQRIKVNAQMLKLLSELGIKPSQSDGDGDDDDM